MNTRKHETIEHLASSNRQICPLVALTLFIDPVLGILATHRRPTANRPEVVAGPSLSVDNTHGCFFTDQVWRHES